MPIEYPTLRRMVKSPNAEEFHIVRRHYCTQMYLNSLCSTHCLEQCSKAIQSAFEFSRGEFILYPRKALVGAARQEVYRALYHPRISKIETPKNEWGEEIPESDVFNALAQEYEAEAAQRRT